MTRFNIFSVFLVFLLLNPDNLFSQQENIFINPGVKFGYTFGQNGGFTWGLELSLTSFDTFDGVSYGAVIDVDFWNGRRKIHLGAEMSYIYAGLCVGPTWITENGKTNAGYSIIPFAGAMIYPYYNFTKVGDVMFSEVGTYAKGYLYTGDGYFKLIH